MTCALSGAQVVLGNTFSPLVGVPVWDVIGGARAGLRRFNGLGPGRFSPIRAASRCSASAKMRKITEEGVRFRLAGPTQRVFSLSPEESMRIQRVLESDIAMVFDECTPVSGRSQPGGRVDASLSLRWGGNAAGGAHEGNGNAPFRYCSGGACTRTCATRRSRPLTDIAFDGYAIGGAVGG